MFYSTLRVSIRTNKLIIFNIKNYNKYLLDCKFAYILTLVKENKSRYNKEKYKVTTKEF